MYRHTYETRYGDYRDFDTIKKGTIIDIIQDISTKCSSDSGYDMYKLRNMKKAWLLKGFNIHFEDSVNTHSPILAETAIKPYKGATSQRCCRLYQGDTLKVKSVAEWFLFDTEKLRPVRIPPEIAAAYEICEFDDPFYSYRKPETKNDIPVCYTIRVSNKDIDTNMHLNNQKSADILMDALPFDYEFNNISMLYRKPAYLGDELDVCISKTEHGYYVHLQTAQKEICVVGTFENI